MKKFRIIETRQNERGEFFTVSTDLEAKSKEDLRKSIEENKPLWLKDKNYRIKEIEEYHGTVC